MGSMTELNHKGTGKKWKLEVCRGKDLRGKRIRHTKVIYGTKTEAKKALAEMEAYYGTGAGVSDQTFAGFCDEYYQRREATLAPSSLRTLRGQIKTFKTLFGEEVMLKDITPAMIDEALLALRKGDGPSGKPDKPSHVGTMRAALKLIMEDATRLGCILENPMPKVQKWSPRAERRTIPAEDVIDDVIDRLDLRQAHHFAVLLAITLGLRRQEIAALQFRDIDYEHNVIHIRRSVQQGDGEEFEVDHCKTDAGIRDLPIPDFLPEMLEIRKHRLLGDIEYAVRLGTIEKAPEQLYVCGTELGERLSLYSLSGWWSRNKSWIGASCTMHDLRHAFVSKCCRAGISPEVSKELAGHSSIRTTMDIYTHVDDEMKQDAMRRVVDTFDFGDE